MDIDLIRCANWRKGWDYTACGGLCDDGVSRFWAALRAGSRTAFSSHGIHMFCFAGAEGVGFEPTVGLTLRSISSRVPSTGLSHPSIDLSGNLWAKDLTEFPVYKRLWVLAKNIRRSSLACEVVPGRYHELGESKQSRALL